MSEGAKTHRYSRWVTEFDGGRVIGAYQQFSDDLHPFHWVGGKSTFDVCICGHERYDHSAEGFEGCEARSCECVSFALTTAVPSAGLASSDGEATQQREEVSDSAVRVPAMPVGPGKGTAVPAPSGDGPSEDDEFHVQGFCGPCSKMRDYTNGRGLCVDCAALYYGTPEAVPDASTASARPICPGDSEEPCRCACHSAGHDYASALAWLWDGYWDDNGHEQGQCDCTPCQETWAAVQAVLPRPAPVSQGKDAI